MLPIVQEACDAFTSESPDFWLLAGATDVSFETGGSSRYRHQVDILRECGCPADLVSQLLQGVNGNIARIIEQRHPELHPFHPNVGRNGRLRPDVWFGPPGSCEETVVEIKALYEMTMPKFFSAAGTHCVADDRRKLEKIRQSESAFRGSLLQVVWFLELPNYSYPAGESLHRNGWRRSEARDTYRYFGSVTKQFAELRNHLPPPTFPANDAPQVQTLSPPTPMLTTVLERWCPRTFRPAEAWCIQSNVHLSGVRVGYAIWQC
jgi:hypothetical protein